MHIFLCKWAEVYDEVYKERYYNFIRTILKYDWACAISCCSKSCIFLSSLISFHSFSLSISSSSLDGSSNMTLHNSLFSISSSLTLSSRAVTRSFKLIFVIGSDPHLEHFSNRQFFSWASIVSSDNTVLQPCFSFLQLSLKSMISPCIATCI